MAQDLMLVPVVWLPPTVAFRRSDQGDNPSPRCVGRDHMLGRMRREFLSQLGQCISQLNQIAEFALLRLLVVASTLKISRAGFLKRAEVAKMLF